MTKIDELAYSHAELLDGKDKVLSITSYIAGAMEVIAQIEDIINNPCVSNKNTLWRISNKIKELRNET